METAQSPHGGIGERENCGVLGEDKSQAEHGCPSRLPALKRIHVGPGNGTEGSQELLIHSALGCL